MLNYIEQRFFASIKIVCISNVLLIFLISSGWALENTDIDMSSIIEKLNHSDENIRKEAAYSLGKLGQEAKATVPTLIEALKDEKIDVRKASIYALGHIGQEAKPAVPVLIDMLKDEDVGVRKAVASALGSIGVAAIPAVIKEMEDEYNTPFLSSEEGLVTEAARKVFKKIGADAVPILVEALKDNSVRCAATYALGFFGKKAKAAVPALMEALKDGNANVRKASMHALVNINWESETAASILIETLKDNNQEVREESAHLLGRIGPFANVAVPALIDALKDENANVRRAAAHSLIMFSPENAVPVLIEALKDEDADVCISAADDLGFISFGPGNAVVENAIPVLLELLKNKNTSIRMAAAYALAYISPNQKPAIPVLIEALNDKDSYQIQTAARALGKIGSGAKDAIPTLIDRLNDGDDIVREAVTYALEKIGEAAIPALLETLENEIGKGGFPGDEYPVEEAAGKALKNICAGAIDTLIESLKDKDIRCAAAYVLESIGTDAKAAAPVLIKALNDEDDDFRRYAILALGSIGSEARTAVPAIIEALKYNDNRRAAVDALGRIGSAAKTAVPVLIDILKNEEEFFIRSDVVRALGNIGSEKKATIPVLVDSLSSQNFDISQQAAIALGKFGFDAKKAVPYLIDAFLEALDKKDIDEPYKVIAHALIEIAEALQESEDTAYLPFLEPFGKFLDHPELFESQDVGRMRRSIQALKAIENRRLSNILMNLIRQHKVIVVIVAYLVPLVSLWFAILLIRPLWLLRINDVLKPLSPFIFTLPGWGRIRIPLQYVFLVGFFHYHKRVLDAWVSKYANLANETFQKKDSVRDRQVHIAMPVLINGGTIGNLTAEHLRPLFNMKRWCLLIWGEGGSGKTSLAYQLAKSAMADDESVRLCKKHLMLPVLIEEDLHITDNQNKHPLSEAIRGELGVFIGEEDPISEELVIQLLRCRRILVIVDHFSEMNEVTRKTIRPNDPEFPSNALIITSRIEEKLGGIPKTTVSPIRIQGNRLSSFMEAYLMQRAKRDLFNDTEYFDACRKLSLMVGNRDITVLLAKLFAEQMISNKEECTGGKLPKNIPDLMLSYINEINHQIEDNKLDDRTVHRIAKVVAWECMKHNYYPTPAKCDDILNAMGNENNAKEHLKYLENRLRLIQTIGLERNQIRFALDPMAEYLAGLHLLDYYGGNENLWREFISRTGTISNTPENIKGFISAVYNCCLFKGTDAKVPCFIQDELAKIIGPNS
ncbi:MAG: HEAT repeat domain-containing protein [Planctomycetes bacterium]|nr:HEAT repeat domain-containing protein [Planctomycetota bacterium]